MPLTKCPCGSGEYPWDLLDAQGIYCGKVCSKCEDDKRAEFRPEIFSGYSQADVDEDIEPEPECYAHGGQHHDCGD